MHGLSRIPGLLFVALAILAPAVAIAEEAPVPMARPAWLDTPERTPSASPASPEAPEATPETAAAPSPGGGAAAAAAAALAQPPEDVTLTARISDEGPQIPDGLVWRVFGTQPNAQGELDMVARSEDAVASISLPPGEYLVHAAYGRAQVSDTLEVGSEPTAKTVIMEAGALKLESSVTGDFAIPPSQLHFDIYSSGLDEDRVPVALDVRSDAVVYLNAGVYNVVSRWGDLNATVRADLRVEPGQVTEATLYHKAAQITWKLVSTAGGEAIADVDWTIQDSDGTQIYTDFGAFPTAVLAEGDYVAIAKLGDNVYNRQFQVQAGPPRDVEVLTSVYQDNGGSADGAAPALDTTSIDTE